MRVQVRSAEALRTFLSQESDKYCKNQNFQQGIFITKFSKNIFILLVINVLFFTQHEKVFQNENLLIIFRQNILPFLQPFVVLHSK